MRKIFFTALMLQALTISAQSRFYDDTLNMMNGNLLTLNCLQGKKVLIASVSIDSLVKETLLFLDSLQSERNDLIVIVVPAIDYSTLDDSTLMRKLRRLRRVGNFVTRPMLVRKSDGTQQCRILRWLTDKSYNKHNDDDVVKPDQWYMVDENGHLYAVLEDIPSPDLLNQLLAQAPLAESD